jgi:hypothetical protein
MDPEAELNWAAVQSVLLEIFERLGDAWPAEWIGLSNEVTLQSIVQTEEQLRPVLDATARSLARDQRMPKLTVLERWHFAHRVVYAVVLAKEKAEQEEEFADGDGDRALEDLLVASWGKHVPVWREQMRQNLIHGEEDDSRTG